ncbi:MAG: glycosyltransferase family 2 protein [Gemmatimonadales bacterium]
MSVLGGIIDAANLAVLAYFVVINAVYLAMSLQAIVSLRRYARRLKSLDLSEILSIGGIPPITVVVPAHNEEATCVESVRALLGLQYPEFEVLVVNDGSRDATLARLQAAFDLVPAPRSPTATLATAAIRATLKSRSHPRLWVIDKENGGKADALNAGINHCRTPLFCAIDADSLLERDALVRIVRPFLEDDATVAAGGIIRIANGCDVRHGTLTRIGLPGNQLARLQVMEYLRAFLAGRAGWSGLNATLIVSGAFGLFRRQTVVDAGGYDRNTVGEDMELIVRLHRHCRDRRRPYRITFVPDPAAWTECPETLRILGRQRERWQRGLAETMARHRAMLFNPRYGRIGMIAMPYFFVLETLGPILEVGGYFTFGAAVLLGRLSLEHALAFFVLAFMLGLALSLAGIALEELTFRRYPRMGDLLTLLGIAVIESFGYRQLSSLWRVRGLWGALRRRRSWGVMTRTGFATAQR